jgi:hypothetical protein
MTTVNRVLGGQGAARAQGTKSTSAGFRLPPSGAVAADAGEVKAVVGVGATLGLLGVQALGDALERDARAKRDGMTALGDLRALQLAMIEGKDLGAVLDRLERLPFSEAADPALREIIDEVRARVGVEAARREALRRRQQAGCGDSQASGGDA